MSWEVRLSLASFLVRRPADGFFQSSFRPILRSAPVHPSVLAGEKRNNHRPQVIRHAHASKAVISATRLSISGLSRTMLWRAGRYYGVGAQKIRYSTIRIEGDDILDSCTYGEVMCASCVEDEIAKLGPEASEIYFDAKNDLASMQDSRSERFSRAARIVRAFWKRVGSNQHNTPVGPTSKSEYQP
jgi:hypothetical protein